MRITEYEQMKGRGREFSIELTAVELVNLAVAASALIQHWEKDERARGYTKDSTRLAILRAQVGLMRKAYGDG